jgi:hypothetical protein
MNKWILLTVGCALLLGTAGPARTASAAQGGRLPVYDCRVTYNGKMVGLAVVNTADASLPSYVLVAWGLTPNTKYTFGYTARSEEYTIGSKETTEEGALVIEGRFPVDEPKSLASARFWVRETLPTSSGWLNGFVLGNYYGWFITRIACYYSTDGGVTWIESSHTGDITKGESKRVLLKDLGVPDGARVRIHAIVIGGKDRTGSEIFLCSYMSCGLEYSTRYATYYIDGVTWNPVLDYIGTVDIR